MIFLWNKCVITIDNDVRKTIQCWQSMGGIKQNPCCATICKKDTSCLTYLVVNSCRKTPEYREINYLNIHQKITSSKKSHRTK